MVVIDGRHRWSSSMVVIDATSAKISTTLSEKNLHEGLT